MDDRDTAMPERAGRISSSRSPPQQPASAIGSSRGAARSMSGRASAGFVALMIALIIPSATACDGVIETSVSPTASSPSRNSEIDSAPAMQPAYEPRSARCSAAQRILGDDVADADPAARPEDAGDLGEDGRLVGGEVDDAVADDDVDRLGGQRDGLDVALQELDVRRAGLGGVVLGEREHLVGHVEAERAAGRADPLGRQQDVDPAARPEVEHALAGMEVGDRGRVAAAERREDRGVRQLVALERGVQVRRRWSRGRCSRTSPGRLGRRRRRSAPGRSRGWSRWSWLGLLADASVVVCCIDT